MTGDTQPLQPEDRSLNSITPVEIASTSISRTTVSVRNYDLNKSNCILKKLQATDRPNFMIDVNDDPGKCIVVTCSTAAYELFKPAVKKHYSKAIKDGKALLKEGIDNKNHVVDLSLKISKKGHMYVINMYNTTSRIMVNGKDYKNFLPELDDIVSEVEKSPIKAINMALKTQLQVSYTASISSSSTAHPNQQGGMSSIPALTDRRRSKRSTKKTTKWDPSDHMTKSAITMRSNAPECIICAMEASESDMALECSKCSGWIHVYCDPKLSIELYRQHQDDENLEYHCTMCEYDNNFDLDAIQTQPDNNYIHVDVFEDNCSKDTTCSEKLKDPAIMEPQDHADNNYIHVGIIGDDCSRDTTCSEKLKDPQDHADLHQSKNTDIPRAVKPSPTTTISAIVQKSAISQSRPTDHILSTQPSHVYMPPVSAHKATKPAPPHGLLVLSSSINTRLMITTSKTTTPTTCTTTVTQVTGTTPVPQVMAHTQSMVDVNHKKRERDLKKWENDLKREAANQAETMKELAGARVIIEKYEYEINQLKHSKRIQQNVIRQMEAKQPPTTQPNATTNHPYDANATTHHRHDVNQPSTSASHTPQYAQPTYGASTTPQSSTPPPFFSSPGIPHQPWPPSNSAFGFMQPPTNPWIPPGPAQAPPSPWYPGPGYIHQPQYGIDPRQMFPAHTIPAYPPCYGAQPSIIINCAPIPHVPNIPLQHPYQSPGFNMATPQDIYPTPETYAPRGRYRHQQHRFPRRDSQQVGRAAASPFVRPSNVVHTRATRETQCIRELSTIRRKPVIEVIEIQPTPPNYSDTYAANTSAQRAIKTSSTNVQTAILTSDAPPNLLIGDDDSNNKPSTSATSKDTPLNLQGVHPKIHRLPDIPSRDGDSTVNDFLEIRSPPRDNI